MIEVTSPDNDEESANSEDLANDVVRWIEYASQLKAESVLESDKPQPSVLNLFAKREE